LKTLFELLRETPGNMRTKLLCRINEKINEVFNHNNSACTLSIITNVFSPVALPVGGAILNIHAMQVIEQALIKFKIDKCSNLYVILSTLGGDIHFPELFISKVQGMGFNEINVIIPSIAMSAGTLLAMLADKVIGLSSASIGPIDPQLIIQTPRGLRVISAIAYKRLIEETLPELASQKKLGTTGLARLYIAQDMYLYQESLRSLKYVRQVLNTYVKSKLNENNYEKLLKIFLTNVETHSRPLGLRTLKELGFNVVLLDEDDRYRELIELIEEYYSMVERSFLFEKSQGIKVLLIGTKYGELIQEAVIYPPSIIPETKPRPKEKTKKDTTTSIEHIM